MKHLVRDKPIYVLIVFLIVVIIAPIIWEAV